MITSRSCTNGEEPNEIYGIIVSHMDHEKRWLYFKHMVNSIKHQTVQLDRLIVFMSFPDKESMTCKSSMLKELKLDLHNTIKHVHIVSYPSPVSQGSAWMSLCKHKHIPKKRNVWCLFGDDDDIWNKNRVKLYRQSISFASINPYCTDIRHNVYIEGKLPDGIAYPSDANIQANNICQRDGSGRNFWVHCIRAPVFHSIINDTNSFMRKNKFFDVMLHHQLGGYMFPDGQTSQYFPVFNTKCWLYFYRHWEGSICGKIQTDRKDELLNLLLSKLHPVNDTIDEYLNNLTQNDIKQYGNLKLYKSILYKKAIQFRNQLPTEVQKRIDSRQQTVR
jgi:hypothetical protein